MRRALLEERGRVTLALLAFAPLALPRRSRGSGQPPHPSGLRAAAPAPSPAPAAGGGGGGGAPIQHGGTFLCERRPALHPWHSLLRADRFPAFQTGAPLNEAAAQLVQQRRRQNSVLPPVSAPTRARKPSTMDMIAGIFKDL